MKEKNADFSSWRILCALAEKIKAMEPWKQFEDMELFVLHFAQQKPVYCSIMGFHQMCYGISFYEGEEGFKDISTVAFEIDDQRFENYVTMESAFYSLYFDDQENVSYEQQQIYDKLGIDPKQYFHFTVKEKGCFPDDPDEKEVNRYILYLAGLIEAIEYFLKEEVLIDFKRDMFVYDVESKKGSRTPFVLQPKEYEAIIPVDEKYLDALSNLECCEEHWEMEYNYINQGVEREDGRVANLRVVMAACREDGKMLCCVPLESDADENEAVLDALFQMIEQNGRPKSIALSNARMYPMIGPVCDFLGIEIEESDELYIIDDFLEGFFQYANQTMTS